MADEDTAAEPSDSDGEAVARDANAGDGAVADDSETGGGNAGGESDAAAPPEEPETTEPEVGEPRARRRALRTAGIVVGAVVAIAAVIAGAVAAVVAIVDDDVYISGDDDGAYFAYSDDPSQPQERPRHDSDSRTEKRYAAPAARPEECAPEMIPPPVVCRRLD